MIYSKKIAFPPSQNSNMPTKSEQMMHLSKKYYTPAGLSAELVY